MTLSPPAHLWTLEVDPALLHLDPDILLQTGQAEHVATAPELREGLGASLGQTQRALTASQAGGLPPGPWAVPARAPLLGRGPPAGDVTGRVWGAFRGAGGAGPRTNAFGGPGVF